MIRPLDIINQLAMKSDVFLFDEFAAVHGGSPSAASNALRRLVDAGVVERVARGAYVIRPIGRMGTRAVTEDIALAVGARFGRMPHRIAYRTALDFHGLLTRPTRKIQMATESPLSITDLGGRPFHAICESASTIDVGTMSAGRGARVSDIERSLLDGARRVDLVGGVSTVADALSRLSAGDYDPGVIVRYADTLDLAGALRRLGSIAKTTGRHELVDAALRFRHHRHLIPADPRRSTGTVWVDPDFKVAWHQDQLDELGMHPEAA
jgi:predicted transcriptional regulator of viral defense system